jgi:predicted RNA-binding protein Jag
VLTGRQQAELSGRVDAWLAAAPLGGKAPPLHFEPNLTADERKFVHTLCEARRSEMSSKSEGSGDERHVVVYHTPIEAGMVCGVSAARRAELAARVEAFEKDVGQASQGLHFEPSLTTAEREFVHQVAAQHGLRSKSEGKVYHGADWHIVVRR